MACEGGLACLSTSGCVEALPAGTVGQVLVQGAAGAAWQTAELHPAASLDPTSNPALTLVAASQIAKLDLTVSGSYSPAVSGLASDNVKAALDELALCRLCSIAPTNTCAAGGVGSDYAIKTATLTDGVLTLNGANEHTSINAQLARQVVPITGNFPAQPARYTLATRDMIMTNPSPCRAMRALIVATFYIDLILETTQLNDGAGIMNLLVDGAFINNATQRTPTIAGYNHTTIGATCSAAVTIPAGASITVTQTVFYQVDNGSFTAPGPQSNLIWHMNGIASTV